MTNSKYIPTIGIECHVQLNTKTKLFAAVGNDARAAPPNTLISHICVALPGALPVLNAAAVDLVTKAAFALNVKPQKFSKFDRKHYFYPDLPKGYQISQYDQPLIVGGHVHIEVNGQKKCIRIERANLEEDAGKNTHPAGADYSLVDLNRAGTPLLEIVSMPDIHSAAEAKAYARELWLLMKYAGVTDGDLYHGHVRFDVNVSVSNNPKELGTRSEIKNLNSFRNVEAAVDYEIKRQTELLKKGEKVVQETRGWDEAKQKSVAQRSKEEAEDYRYMPEPDIPPIELDDAYIAKVRAEMPVLPTEWRHHLSGLGLDSSQMETLLDAHAEIAEVDYLGLLKMMLDDKPLARQVANWLVNTDIPFTRGLQVSNPDADRQFIYRQLFGMAKGSKISSTNAKALIMELLATSAAPKDLEKYAEEKGYVQVSDEDEIEKIVAEVLADNPKAAEDVKKGEMKAIGFLVGQVMAKSKGQANPTLAQKLIKKQLGL